MDISKIQDQLFFTTVIIESSSAAGMCTGTGYFCRYIEGEKAVQLIVTCRHVVEGFDNYKLSVIGANEDGSPRLGHPEHVVVPSAQANWHFHPNPNVDIAVAPMGFVFRAFNDNGVRIFFRELESSFLPSEEELRDLSAIEDVTFVGYPNGIFDRKNLLPVARRGTTATPIGVDYCGLPAFLIDASVFPGSSGSPVFILSEGTIRQGTGFRIGRRFHFIGTVAAVHHSESRGRLIVESTPTAQTVVPVTRQFLNLGMVFKAHTVIEAAESMIEKYLSRAS